MVICAAGFVPHPPVIVSAVGKGREREAQATVMAMAQLAQSIIASQPDVLFVLSPHAAMSRTFLPLHAAAQYQGSFARFGVPAPAWTFAGERTLIEQLAKLPFVKTKAHADLDHGALVPLTFLAEAGFSGSIVLVGMPLADAQTIFDWGQSVAQVLVEYPKRVAVVISGDLSHCLTPEAPNGYSPQGKEYDDSFVDLMRRWDTVGLLAFDGGLAEQGQQDSLWPAQFLTGAMSSVQTRPQFLSYEGPFGVGYLVQVFEIS